LTESSALRSRGASLVSLVTPVVAVSSGAKVLLHEARIIATKERAEMKTIEFFIAGKIVVDRAGHSITNRREPIDIDEARKVERAGANESIED